VLRRIFIGTSSRQRRLFRSSPRELGLILSSSYNARANAAGERVGEEINKILYRNGFKYSDTKPWSCPVGVLTKDIRSMTHERAFVKSFTSSPSGTEDTCVLHLAPRQLLSSDGCSVVLGSESSCASSFRFEVSLLTSLPSFPWFILPLSVLASIHARVFEWHCLHLRVAKLRCFIACYPRFMIAGLVPESARARKTCRELLY